MNRRYGFIALMGGRVRRVFIRCKGWNGLGGGSAFIRGIAGGSGPLVGTTCVGFSRPACRRIFSTELMGRI